MVITIIIPYNVDLKNKNNENLTNQTKSSNFRFPSPEALHPLAINFSFPPTPASNNPH